MSNNFIQHSKIETINSLDIKNNQSKVDCIISFFEPTFFSHIPNIIALIEDILEPEAVYSQYGRIEMENVTIDDYIGVIKIINLYTNHNYNMSFVSKEIATHFRVEDTKVMSLNWKNKLNGQVVSNELSTMTPEIKTNIKNRLNSNI